MYGIGIKHQLEEAEGELSEQEERNQELRCRLDEVSQDFLRFVGCIGATYTVNLAESTRRGGRQ